MFLTHCPRCNTPIRLVLDHSYGYPDHVITECPGCAVVWRYPVAWLPTLGEPVVEDVPITPPDTLMVCRTCGRGVQISFAACLSGQRPWPRCCGHALAFQVEPSAALIEAAVGQLFAPAVQAALATVTVGRAGA